MKTRQVFKFSLFSSFTEHNPFFYNSTFLDSSLPVPCQTLLFLLLFFFLEGNLIILEILPPPGNHKTPSIRLSKLTLLLSWRRDYEMSASNSVQDGRQMWTMMQTAKTNRSSPCNIFVVMVGGWGGPLFPSFTSLILAESIWQQLGGEIGLWMVAYLMGETNIGTQQLGTSWCSVHKSCL